MDIFDIDPRTTMLPMVASPIPTILICIAYLIFVKNLGPAWMRNRKPYDLKGLMIVYNFTLVIANAWMFHKFGKHGWYWRYSWICANIDNLQTEDSMRMVDVCWFFFISKFFELADTVFFVLRKKDSQVTFLHVFHHATVPLAVWNGINHNASGYNTLFCFLNTFVHTWMYLYYGLAALGLPLQKYLRWKKYLTTLQMLQFCLMILAMIFVIIVPGCKVSWRMIANYVLHAIFYLFLFAQFFQNSYRTKRKTKSSENGSECKHIEELNGDSVNKISHDD